METEKASRTEMLPWQDLLILDYLAKKEKLENVIEKTGKTQAQIETRIEKLEEMSKVFLVPIQKLTSDPRTYHDRRIAYPAKNWNPMEEQELLKDAMAWEEDIIALARKYERPPFSINKKLRQMDFDLTRITGTPEWNRKTRMEAAEKAKEERIKAALLNKPEESKTPVTIVNQKEGIQSTLADLTKNTTGKEQEYPESIRYLIRNVYKNMKDLSQAQSNIAATVIKLEEKVDEITKKLEEMQCQTKPKASG